MLLLLACHGYERWLKDQTDDAHQRSPAHSLLAVRGNPGTDFKTILQRSHHRAIAMATLSAGVAVGSV